MRKIWTGQNEKIKYLSEKELRHFLKTIIKKNKMHFCLFNLIYSYGLRVSEVVSLKVENLNFDEKRILIERRKRKDKFRIRSYKLSEENIQRLKSWLRKRSKHRSAEKGNPYLFLSNKTRKSDQHISIPQVQAIFHKYAIEAGLKDGWRYPHVLKHSAGIMLAKSGASGATIRDRLGHVSMITTDIYTQLVGGEREEADGKADEALEL